MGGEEERGYDLDIPVVTSRREFFEQEAQVAGPPEDLDADLDADEVAEALKRMREGAAGRTEAVEQGRAEDGSDG